MKTCSKCHEHKEFIKFRQSQHSSDGLGSWCKTCCKEYEAIVRAEKRNNSFKPKRKLGPTQAERKAKLTLNERWCNLCRDWRSSSEFPKRSKDIKSKSYTCRSCASEKEYIRSQLPNVGYGTYKRNAGYRNLKFELSFEQFMQFWQKPCVYCLAEIQTIGLDRVDNNIGYTMGNIITCCGDCNIMRNDQTQDEFIKRVIKIANGFITNQYYGK